MRTFLRVLAVLILIPTVVLLVVGLVVLDLRLTLLSPVFLERLLVRQEVYRQLPELAVDVMFEQMHRGPTGEEGGEEEPEPSEGPQGALVAAELEEKFGRQALVDFFEALVPPAWVRQQVEYNVEALFAWLEGEDDYPDLRLTLGDLGERLDGEEGREAMRTLWARLQPCEPGEDFFRGGELFPHCRPPDQELDLVMAEALPRLRAGLPGDLSFQARLEEGEIRLEELENVRGAYSAFILVMWALWLACAVLLGLVLLLAARSLDQVLRWVGWPLLVAGVLGLVVMGITFVVTPSLVVYGLAQGSSEGSLPIALMELTGSLLKGLLRGMASRGLVLSGGLAFLGCGAVVAAAFFRRARE
jgi:hypothetical protein